MRRQERGVTQPRPPSVAEARAREKAERQQREAQQLAQQTAERKRKRNRRLIGGAAVVGVVGVVAGLGYWALSGDDVTAQCVQEDVNGQPVIVDDDYCDESGSRFTSSGGHVSNGFFIYSGHQYRYYYGSKGSVGQRPSGGTTVKPKGATIKTKSGTTIQRGGLGSKSGGKSSGS
mgnify:CR=1 FL=1